MKKFLLPLIFILLFSTTITPVSSKTLSQGNSSEFIQLIKKNIYKGSDKQLKKKKLKKVVRKAGRVYRNIKQDRNSRKKSRRVQRTAKIIINIF